MDDELARLPTASCVKLYAVGALSSYLLPWQVGEQAEWTGSGFAVAVGGAWRLLTNAHVVDGAFVIRATRQGESRKVEASVVACAHDLDLALLDVEDEGFRQSVPPVQFADRLPPLFSEVKAIGYPEGGSTICVTKGVVSRVDAQLYAHAEAKGIFRWGYNNPGSLLIVQIDAAINHGNSGGPALDTHGKVVGVASSAIGSAQNIGYVIPGLLVQGFLDEVLATGCWAGIPEPGFTYRKLESPPLREFLKLPQGRTGVQLTSVAPLGACGGLLRRGDVLLCIDGHGISNEGTVPLALSSGQEAQLPFEYLITSKRRGQETTLSVLRAGSPEAEEVTMQFAPIPPLLPRFDGYDASPSYFVFGGLVFTRLSTPFFQEYLSSESHRLHVPELVFETFRRWRARAEEEVVVLARVLRHPVNEGIQPSVVRIVERVNDTPVTNLEDLVGKTLDAAAAGRPFVALSFRAHATGAGSAAGEVGSPNDSADMWTEVLNATEALAANRDILAQHQVPSPVSPDLEDVYYSRAPNIAAPGQPSRGHAARPHAGQASKL